jgi:arginine/lysine/ornithine decarboxylase
MHTSGTKLTAESLRYAHSFKHAVLTDPAMDAYTINHPAYPKEPFAYIYSNPSKISLNISGTGLSPEAFCDKLLNHYGIYINRSDKDSVLLNFHIGINASAFDHLLYALKEIGRHAKTKKVSLNLQPESISQSYIISYPPGVPLVVPGEQLNQRHCEVIEAMRHSGKLVIQA